LVYKEYNVYEFTCERGAANFFVSDLRDPTPDAALPVG
jgi:hypothetical protein